MVFHTKITVIHSQRNGKRVVMFAGIVLNDFLTKEEAIAFAKNFPEGSRVEVWENDVMIEQFDK